jgi:hypothetical protein
MNSAGGEGKAAAAAAAAATAATAATAAATAATAAPAAAAAAAAVKEEGGSAGDAASGQLPPPRSMTGRTLCFPGCDEGSLKTFSILSWPVAPSSDGHFQISQGELWKGTLDLKPLYIETTTKHSDQVYWCCDVDGKDLPDGERSVLIKVTSNPCYGLLTNGQGFLYQIKPYKKGWPPELIRRIFHLLKDSLYAVYVPVYGSGIVQIMPDLRESGYQQLCPSARFHTREDWIAAWAAFMALVSEVLLPLAEEDVVHVDIRPGFDVTANILHCQENSKMILIDVDSLVEFDKWMELSRSVVGSNLITAKPGPDDPQSSLEYVLWQVIYVAETWISRTFSHAASKEEVKSRLARSPTSYDRASIDAELDRYGQEIARVAADLAQAARSAAEASAEAPSSLFPGAAGAAAPPVPAVTADTNQPVRMTTRSKRGRPEP